MTPFIHNHDTLDPFQPKPTHPTTPHTDYGVHRGIDFQAVSFVVNVDLPRSARAYTHRVGRTARGGANGTALSLVAKGDARQAATLAEVQASQPALPPLEGDTFLEALPAGRDSGAGVGMGLHARAQPAPLAFDLRELEGFRYRVEDVKRAVTKVAVKEARLAEIKQELLNSEALKGHFQENPHEFQVRGRFGLWCVGSCGMVDDQPAGRGYVCSLTTLPLYLCIHNRFCGTTRACSPRTACRSTSSTSPTTSSPRSVGVK